MHQYHAAGSLITSRLGRLEKRLLYSRLSEYIGGVAWRAVDFRAHLDSTRQAAKQKAIKLSSRLKGELELRKCGLGIGETRATTSTTATAQNVYFCMGCVKMDVT